MACGCTPIITHPPHIERGVFLGGAFAIGRTQYDSAAHSPVRLGAQLTGTASAGWRSKDRDLPAVLGAVRFPFFFGGGDLDAYVEAPERWLGAFDVGAGLDAPWINGHGLVGYLQFGRRKTTGLGWFTTQGVGRLVTTTGIRSQLLWFPTIALGGSGDYGAFGEVFATGVVGRQVTTCPPGITACEGNYTRPMFFIGIAAHGNVMRAF